jgi:MarC family membrane protein
MDAIGNIPIFISLLKKLPAKRQRFIILRELTIALITMLLFYFSGNFFLSSLGISDQTVSISGGIILMLIALKMIFPSQQESTQGPLDTEPFIVPLAIPLIAGPAILATVMIYSRQGIVVHHAVISICIAWALSTLILILAPSLQKVLGQRGIDALERLMGLILMLLAIQMFLNGVSGFVLCHKNM